MDGSKQSVLLLWIGKVWGRQIKSITELEDGCFFLYVLRAISHCSQQANDLDESDVKNILLTVKKCLQGFYGTEDFNGVLDFDCVYCDDINKKEFELAKIAVVLLGVALIDKQGGDIVQKASMELPDHLHTGVVNLLEAVVQRHSGPRLMLTSAIEEALRTPMEKQCDIALESWFQMPKFECNTSQELKNVSGTSLLKVEADCIASPQARMSTPLNQGRKGSVSTPLNTSFGISSPFRDLNINSSVSPFVSYIQSPQLIRKAAYNEKELELRQLKSRLNEEILLKEDVQLSLRDQIEDSAKKDSEINELKNRIRELQFLQDAYDELQELKPKHAELEAKCDKFMSRQQKLDQYKSECRILEKEGASQRDEIQALLQEIQGLKSQNQEKSEILMTKNSMEKQMSLLKAQLEESSRVKMLMEEELMSARNNLQMTEEKFKELQKLTENCNDESFQGESMGVVTDIQLGEMKSKVDKLSEERNDMQTEIHGLKTSMEEQNSYIEELKKQVEASQEMNESLVSQLRGKCTDIESLKSHMTEKEADYKNALAVLKAKHDDDVKAVHVENEKKVSSLVEGHKVFTKRLQTAAEKISMEKDSVIQEGKDLEKKIHLLQEKHTKEIETIKVESEKQLSHQSKKFEQDILDIQEQNETKKLELINEHEQEVKKLEDINEQKLLLQKEEHEIQLMKAKEDLLCDLKSQKSNFESQITKFQEINDKQLSEKEGLMKEIESMRNEMTKTFETEKVVYNNQIQKLTEEHQEEVSGMKSKFEMELSSLRADSETNIKSLQDKLISLKKENAVTVDLLRTEHENAAFDRNEKMALTVQQYEKEVDDLQRRIQEREEQKAKLEEDLSRLKDTMTVSFQEQHNIHMEEISALQQNNDSKLTSMEQEHKHQVERLSIGAQETLTKLKDEMEGVISELKDEVASITSQKLTVDEQLSTLLNEHNELREQLLCLTQKNSDILSCKCAVEEKLDSLDKEHSQLLEAKTSLEKQIESLQKEKEGVISELKNEVASITSQKLTVDEQLSTLLNEHNELREQLLCLTQKNSDILSCKCAVEEKLDSLDKEHSQLLEAKTSLEKQVESLQKENEELLCKTEEIQAELTSTEDKRCELYKERQELENAIAKYESDNVDFSYKCKELREELSTLQCQHSKVFSAKELAEEKYRVLNQEKLEIASKIETAEESVRKVQKENSEISSQKSVVENELSVLQENLVHVSAQKLALETELATLQSEKSDVVSQKIFIEEELSCLRLENTEVVSQKVILEEKVTNLLQQISEMTSLKTNVEENLSLKEHDFDELKSENCCLKEKLLQTQEEASLSVRSVTEKFDQEGAQLKRESEQQMKDLTEHHQKELIKVEEEREVLMKEIATLRGNLDSAMSEIQQAESLMTENEKLARSFKKEILEKLEQERSAHEEKVTRIQNEWEERLSFEKAELESVIVNNMKDDYDAKFLLMKNECDQLSVKLQESVDALTCEKEEHNLTMAKSKEEADSKVMAAKDEFERQLASKENEMRDNLALEKNETEKVLVRLAEEKSIHNQVVSKLQEEAAETHALEKEQVDKLKEDLRAVDMERAELVEKVATLQEETTRMMQIQKAEHEREMQNVRTVSETKILEVTAQCHTEVKTMKAELEEATGHNARQLEEELAKVRLETEMSYESSLEGLRVKFEAAKESELKALSDQKAELSALKKQHEEEIKRQQTKFTELQEENQRLRERETAMLKNMETQMSTANEFCTNLRQQLEASNAKVVKLEANPASREKIKLYEQQLTKQKETVASLNNALQIEKETSGKMQQRLETHITKHEKTKAILENAQKECRVYAIENNRLKTSLDYSERKLKTYQQQLEQAGNAMLGSDAHFKRVIEEHDAEMLNDSLDANTSIISSYSLRSTTSTGSVRSKSSTKSDDGSPNETIISADSVMLRRETLTGSSDLRKKQPPPGFKATMLSCDNEPEEFEWDRLSELKRRNTLCLPHMKSSYPVETQAKKEAGSDEQAVRLSMMPGDMNCSVLHGKRRSPRLSSMHLDEDDKKTCPNKKGKDEASEGTTIYFPLARDGAVYQPPNTLPARLTEKQKLVASGTARKKLTPSKLTKSPGKLVTKARSFKSPGVKGRSPAVTRNNDAENKASVAFSIGFTPKKAGGISRTRAMQKKPTNQDATVLLESKRRTSPQQKVRKPLATRNFRETGI